MTIKIYYQKKKRQNNNNHEQVGESMRLINSKLTHYCQ